jgi:hypothetical protein
MPTPSAVTYSSSVSGTASYDSTANQVIPKLFIKIPASVVESVAGKAVATVILNVPAPYMEATVESPGAHFFIGTGQNESSEVTKKILGTGSISSSMPNQGRMPITVVASYPVPANIQGDVYIGALWSTTRGTTVHLGGGSPEATLTVIITPIGPEV